VADIVDPRVEEYMRSLLERYDDPVLLEMERVAAERNFPIVNRIVGVTLEALARSIGAQRVFELGSGYGYSAYWFARAVGPSGEVYLTDGDPENERKALHYLGRAGLVERVRFRVGDAVTSFGEVQGEFDIVYCDIDKEGYPEAWRAARDRVRVGRVVEESPDDTTKAILEHNAMIAADERYLSVIVPTRDGVMVALRVP
jgi:predicted O-methyltransferase YrrM